MSATLDCPPAENSVGSRSLAALGKLFTPCTMVVLYALAMAWVESAVVFYMRSMIQRIVPYQPNPLPVAGGFGLAELVREASTLIMLLTVGMLAGRTWRSRLGFTLLAFGIWDMAYYLWLIPLTGWPRSLGDWDFLFLIPLPWWGPVWAPVSIAALMVCFGWLVGNHDSPARPLWPTRLGLLSALAGVVLALMTFLEDSLGVVLSGGGLEELRRMLPLAFNWPQFTLALLALSVPVLQVLLQWRESDSPGPGLNHEKWIRHFRHNQTNRTEPAWAEPCPDLSEGQLRPLRRSLEQFQLGDGGGPADLIAFDASQYRPQGEPLRLIIEAWFREEAEHARLLSQAVRRYGGTLIRHHWSFSAFCLCRRLLGVRFELQVLTLTEIVSTGYYRLLRRHSLDPVLRDMCRLILRDEAGHLSFQRDRLQAQFARPHLRQSYFWRTQFWWFGHAAAAVLWLNHGPCLQAFGASRPEYFAEVRRELRRFMAALHRDGALSPGIFDRGSRMGGKRP